MLARELEQDVGFAIAVICQYFQHAYGGSSIYIWPILRIVFAPMTNLIRRPHAASSSFMSEYPIVISRLDVKLPFAFAARKQIKG